MGETIVRKSTMIMSKRVLFLALAMCAALCAASPIGSAEFEDEVVPEDALVQTESGSSLPVGFHHAAAAHANRHPAQNRPPPPPGQVRPRHQCWNACGGRGGTNCPTRVCGAAYRCCRHWHHDPGCSGMGCHFHHCCAPVPRRL